MNLELRPHKSKQVIRDGNNRPLISQDTGKPLRMPHITDTLMVYVEGKHVGYCGNKPGMPINLTIVNPPPAFSAMVKARIEEQLGGQMSKISSPPVKPVIDDGETHDAE